MRGDRFSPEFRRLLQKRMRHMIDNTGALSCIDEFGGALQRLWPQGTKYWVLSDGKLGAPSHLQYARSEVLDEIRKKIMAQQACGKEAIYE